MTRSSSLRVWSAVIALILYVSFILIVTLTPSPIDLEFRKDLEGLLAKLHERGLPNRVDYGFVEFSSNIAFFIPVGFLAALALPLRLSWLALPIGVLFSMAVEYSQYLFLPARFATVQDVAANSLGVGCGVFASVLLRLIVLWRDKIIVGEAVAEQFRRGSAHPKASGF